jgi:hypothetical protein
MTLGAERYGVRVTELAAVLGVRYHRPCLSSRRGATRRQKDQAFAERLDLVHALLASSPPDELNELTENV